MTQINGIIEMNWQTWTEREPEESYATDLAWLEDGNGPDLLDAVADMDLDRLKCFAAAIRQHRESSIGSTGEAKRQRDADRDLRHYRAVQLRWEQVGQQILAGLRSPDLGRHAEALGMLIGVLGQAKIHDPAAVMQRALPQTKIEAMAETDGEG